MNQPSPPSTHHDFVELLPPYLNQIAHLLQKQMPDAWAWAASDELASEDAEAIRLELLRSSMRLDRKNHGEVYEIADAAREKLGLITPVTLYQQQNPIGWNAAAVPLDGAAHVILHGPLIKELTHQELTAVLAHELGHVLLWQQDESRHGIAHRLLESLANDASAASSHRESARLAKLYTEVFCDRIAFQIVGDSHSVISSLLKIGTQSTTVDSEAYLKQAEEIFAVNKQPSQQGSHPEMYIRAKAIQAWFDRKKTDERSVETTVRQMIEGQPELEHLDLVGQAALTRLTRRVLDAVFSQRWLRTDAALAHARLFFDDYRPLDLSDNDLKTLVDDVSQSTSSIKQYVGYLLLDFATSERECEDLPLAVALELAEQFSLSEAFQDLVKRELRLRVKQIRTLNEKKSELLVAAGKGTNT